MPKYQFVPIACDGRRGEALAVAAYDDAVAMKRALGLAGPAAWDIWRGVKLVACVAPASEETATILSELQAEAA
ncbi:hypothetical protein ACO2Q0_06150 [Phenylobacterium sp. VNQ135]|uniref:hypothetical protein n=1 Tax=Phenylobacterium sp. VNQ135 TaxID=3400922 RepID=UPI003C025441